MIFGTQALRKGQSALIPIAFDGTIYSEQKRGGITRYCTALLQHLSLIEPAAHFKVVTGERLVHELPEGANLEHQPVPMKRFHGYPERFWKPLRAVINENYLTQALQLAAEETSDCRLWHGPYYRIPRAWAGPTIITFHDLAYHLFPDQFSSRKARLFAERQRSCADRADLILCVSSSTANDLNRVLGVRSNKLRVVHHGLARDFPDLGANYPGPTDPYVLAVGNRSTIKNMTTLYEAIARWPRNQSVRLVLVGPPASRPEMERLQELGLWERTTFVGRVDDTELSALYSAAQAFVYPSLYEGFGIPLLEAMTCRCPIVASNIPSTREVAGTIPYYFEPLDVDGLVQALDHAVESGRDTTQVEEGRRHASTYSWDTTAALTLDTYRELL